MEKLRLVEAVQYWLMPKLGVMSFALDYVSIQNVTLRLFALPPDAPAPLPPERVFVPGPALDGFSDDYHAPISSLEHDALYDPALPGLLGCTMTRPRRSGCIGWTGWPSRWPATKRCGCIPEIGPPGRAPA